jgi:hypothetical protein
MTRGEVVLVDWPYSDRTGSKIRADIRFVANVSPVERQRSVVALPSAA